MLESVQNSKLYKGIVNTVYKKGLLTNARNNAVNDVTKPIIKDVNETIKDYRGNESMTNNINKAKEFLNKAAENSGKKIRGSQENIDNIREAAISKSMKDSFLEIHNDGEAMKYYNKSLKSIKRKSNLGTVKNVLNDYYVDPFKNGETVTGIARVGLTAGTGIGVGVGAYALSSDDYSYDMEGDNGGVQYY